MNNEKYSAARLELLVKYLREFIGEKSWFDFKSNDVAPDKFGAYLAGLSNAACLANQPFGYLVFGVDIGASAPINEPINEPIKSGLHLLQIIRDNPGLRKGELARLSGIHPSNIKRLIEGCLRGQIEYRGAKKTGGYYVLDNPVNPVNPV